MVEVLLLLLILLIRAISLLLYSGCFVSAAAWQRYPPTTHKNMLPDSVCLMFFATIGARPEWQQDRTPGRS